MSTILFFIIAFAVFAWVVLDRLREDKEWISIMVTSENNRYKLNEKYAYLKANRIRCRIKNIGERGIDQALERGVFNVRAVQRVSLDVYYKDMEKANQLLNK
ncbi:hypothetical protein [Clostridium sp. OS1-26]|uniref:hypothetical protein n=1 Tax=Clostridium sp. OS1-26 TaxID=3070681 RepID=UPI0027E1A5AE|nr:hypothetical protein [Clostridium sp. OS1-26]WML33663.1 hypothetical protein RCG18_20285 [Clostridium sp. OS1-26]